MQFLSKDMSSSMMALTESNSHTLSSVVQTANVGTRSILKWSPRGDRLTEVPTTGLSEVVTHETTAFIRTSETSHLILLQE